ncbi:hypothetical protein EYF80_006246 [Liparis tanakae]|uniref:Uncharacterized protein n=1 Tax=Liparis tanakae TaxID=230148 RepID=A0A4Z2IZ33_9TELE|nr:hypothetical protein EYF80_006246 [Liparis tanakae]
MEANGVIPIPAPIRTACSEPVCKGLRQALGSRCRGVLVRYRIRVRDLDLDRLDVDLYDVKTSHTSHGESHNLLQDEEQTRNHEPLPEVCTVDHQQRPDPHVGQVRPVEHLRTEDTV